MHKRFGAQGRRSSSARRSPRPRWRCSSRLGQRPSTRRPRLQKEVVNARVWGGLHFRNSVEQGENLGNHVADWDLKQAFPPATP